MEPGVVEGKTWMEPFVVEPDCTWVPRFEPIALVLKLRPTVAEDGAWLIPLRHGRADDIIEVTIGTPGVVVGP